MVTIIVAALENQYVANILSDFIFVLLTALLGLLFYRLTRRRNLYSFFGLDSRRVVIYMSNLFIPRKGATSGFGGLPRSYTGSAIPYYEITMLPPLLRFFNIIIPGVGDLPDILKTLTLSDIKIEYKASPLAVGEIDDNSVIFSFGSPGYNVVSDFVQKKLSPKMLMIKDNMQIINAQTGDVMGEGRNVAFLQKVFDKENQRWVFYAAGIDENGTKGALLYLIRNWSGLRRKYGKKAFSICFEFPWSKEDPKGFNKPKILKEL